MRPGGVPSRSGQSMRNWGHGPSSRRQPGTAPRPDRPPCGARRVLRHPPGSGRPRPARGLRHLRAPRHLAERLLQRGPHRRHHPGNRRVPARRRASPARCSSARTPTRSRTPPRTPCWRCWPATTSYILADARTGWTPTPALSHAILAHNADPAAPRADGIIITPSHNPPADGGLKYNPPHGGPADTDATAWIANRANELLEAKLRRGQADPAGRRAAGRQDRVLRLHGVLRQRPALGAGPGRDPRRRHPHRRRPDGRGSGRLLGCHRRNPQAGSHGGEPRGGPALCVHVPGHRREDPHGLLLGRRDGLADRRAAAPSTSPRATTPTPTATASSPPMPG